MVTTRNVVGYPLIRFELRRLSPPSVYVECVCYVWALFSSAVYVDWCVDWRVGWVLDRRGRRGGEGGRG